MAASSDLPPGEPVPDLEPFYRHESGRVFETADEAQEFVEREAAFLSSLASGHSHPHGGPDAGRSLQRLLERLRGRLTSLETDLSARLDAFFGSPDEVVKRLVDLGTPDACFLQDVIKRHGTAAGFAALALKAGVTLHPTAPLALAAADVAIFEHCLDGNAVRGHEERARDLVGRLQAELERTGRHNMAAQKKLTVLHEELARADAGLREKLGALGEEARGKVANTVAELETLVATKTELYSTKLALQAPLTYWKRRQEAQKKTPPTLPRKMR